MESNKTTEFLGFIKGMEKLSFVQLEVCMVSTIIPLIGSVKLHIKILISVGVQIHQMLDL